MIWLTWRQFRAQAAVTYATLAVLAVVLGITGPQLLHRYDTSGTNLLHQLTGADSSLYLIGAIAVLAVPAVIGAFWGAPLITRELDAGTHWLTWNQSITRNRWLATKLGVTGLVAMTATGLLSLAVTWWSGPIDTVADTTTSSVAPVALYFPRLSPVIFDARGIAPIGYAAFGFALGVTLGVLIRRTVPAMAATLAVFVVIRIAVVNWIRPNLMTPRQLTMQITSKDFMNVSGDHVTVAVHQPGAWITAEQTVNTAGQPAMPDVANCLGSGPGQENQACFAAITRGYRQLVSYQPGDRFWTFQLYETAIFLGLAVLLFGCCAWRIRRLS